MNIPTPTYVVGPGTSFACHEHHAPEAELGQEHHVNVQAWQRFWVPPDRKVTTNGIWDPFTIRMPPSCHLAVHLRIVKVMKRFAGLVVVSPNRSDAELLLQSRSAAGLGNLATIAYQSPVRWLNYGGSLRELTAAKLWGES